jgi:nitrate/nitrite transporter NarK
MSVRTSSERALSRFDRWPGIFGLIYGAIGAPLAALYMQVSAYAGVQWSCGHRNPITVHVIPVIFLLLATIALWLSWRDWSAVGRLARAEGATVSERTRFIALAGLMLSAFGIVLILAMWLPMIVFNPCQR